jgi:hypothetical protein
VQTLHSGVRVYKLGETRHFSDFVVPHELGGRYLVTLAFVLRGEAIISGTNSGVVCIWEVGSPGDVPAQTLDQRGLPSLICFISALSHTSTGDIIQAVAVG